YTNMVFLPLDVERARALAAFLRGRGIAVIPAARMRLVTHRDLDERAIDTVLAAAGEYLSRQ
ncbi:MAG: hypothetical protein R3202_08255, partial [Candidatus Competibacterales bacterium]|nr:hypothetical protein [Candidatus Competibacterales bacterium]